VFAIGNPFGLERTLTIGIVSSLNRSIESPSKRKIRSIIQTDAAINPGSSGGPLLDSQGQLIGMNTAIASNTGQSAGVGFAIPSSAIRRIVPQLIQRGKVVRPDVGIVRVLETETGIVIATMSKGGPAEQAGLRGFGLKTQRRRQGPFVFEQTSVDRSTADRIVAVNGQPVTRAEQFLDQIESHRPGEDVALTIEREGRQVNVTVRLGAGE
jgi:S1-C subfamily serine protease